MGLFLGHFPASPLSCAERGLLPALALPDTFPQTIRALRCLPDHLSGDRVRCVPALLRIPHSRHFIAHNYVRVIHADLIFAARDAENAPAAHPFQFSSPYCLRWVTLNQKRFLVLREDGAIAD